MHHEPPNPLDTLDEYQIQLNMAINTINRCTFKKVVELVEARIIEGNHILTMGNGGSAAIANHVACDLMKGIRADTELPAYVQSLCTNDALMTALANDDGFSDVFSSQIEWYPSKDALVIAVSSSGNSKNITDGLIAAQEMNFPTIAFVGFDGGYIVENKLADHVIHVKSENYGIIEDTHMILFHTIGQFLRKKWARYGAALKL